MPGDTLFKGVRGRAEVRRPLEKLGIPRATFYRWYDLYQTGGPESRLTSRHCVRLVHL